MGETAPDLLLAGLAVLLAVAVVGDLRARIIPNRLNAAIALAAPLYWLAAGLGWSDIFWQVGTAVAVFALFALAFRLGAMGGGDVKLITAIALWLPPGATLKLIVIMSVAGGVLTLAMLVRHRLARREAALEVPYGVAIAGAGFWLIGERFLYQFG